MGKAEAKFLIEFSFGKICHVDNDMTSIKNHINKRNRTSDIIFRELSPSIYPFSISIISETIGIKTNTLNYLLRIITIYGVLLKPIFYHKIAFNQHFFLT